MGMRRVRAMRAVLAVGVLALVLAPAAAAVAQTVDEPTTTTTSVPPPPPPPAAPAPGDGGVGALAGPIAGVVVDGDTHERLSGLCVVFFNSGQDPAAYDGSALTDGNGEFGFTPAVDDGQFLLVFRPSVPGDCFSQPLASGPVPEWFGDQPVDLDDPFSVPLGAFTVAGDTNLGICVGSTELHVGRCGGDDRPTGPGVISGRVITNGDVPVAGACVFALSAVAVYGPAVSSADGSYVISGLPEQTEYYVGFVPPFTGPEGPCSTDDGPPPVSAPGDLQPEWYQRVWIDLASPDLDSDPSQVAATAGAIPVATGASGVDGCLTTAAPEVTPRPTCEVAAAQATAADPVTGTLPLTGGRDGTATTAAVGGALMALGAGMLLARRRLGRSAG